MGKSRRGSISGQEAKVHHKVNVMIVDGPSLFHIVKHTSQGLTWRGKPTGIIYGFFRKLLSIAKDLRPETAVFGWDSPMLKRKGVYPGYKANRSGAKEWALLDWAEQKQEREAYQQLHELKRDLLVGLGFVNSFELPGYEADDILANVARQSQLGKMVLVTRDHDLWQCINGSVSWYEPVDKVLVDSVEFNKRWGLPAHMWSAVLQITGCSGDNVEGVVGVGEKTAVSFLRGELKTSGKKYQSIVESEKLIEDNAALVQLPYPDMARDLVIDVVAKPSIKEFANMCSSYGFDSFLRELDVFVDVLRMV